MSWRESCWPFMLNNFHGGDFLTVFKPTFGQFYSVIKCEILGKHRGFCKLQTEKHLNLRLIVSLYIYLKNCNGHVNLVL